MCAPNAEREKDLEAGRTVGRRLGEGAREISLQVLGTRSPRLRPSAPLQPSRHLLQITFLHQCARGGTLNCSESELLWLSEFSLDTTCQDALKSEAAAKNKCFT